MVLSTGSKEERHGLYGSFKGLEFYCQLHFPGLESAGKGYWFWKALEICELD